MFHPDKNCNKLTSMPADCYAAVTGLRVISEDPTEYLFYILEHGGGRPRSPRHLSPEWQDRHHPNA